jgi:hypothetical protein
MMGMAMTSPCNAARYASEYQSACEQRLNQFHVFLLVADCSDNLQHTVFTAHGSIAAFAFNWIFDVAAGSIRYYFHSTFRRKRFKEIFGNSWYPARFSGIMPSPLPGLWLVMKSALLHIASLLRTSACAAWPNRIIRSELQVSKIVSILRTRTAYRMSNIHVMQPVKNSIF